MDGLFFVAFAIVGLTTCGLGAISILAPAVVTLARSVQLQIAAATKDVHAAKLAAGITHEPKIPVSPPQGPGV